MIPAFSATLTTPAIGPEQLAVVWTLILQSEPEGPTLISCAAKLLKGDLHIQISFSRLRGARPHKILVADMLTPSEMCSTQEAASSLRVQACRRCALTIGHPSVQKATPVRNSQELPVKGFAEW